MSSDSKFYDSLVSHLNTLHDSDYFEDDDEYISIIDPTKINDIHNDTKLKPYATNQFKKFLSGFMKEKYKKTPKMTNKYLEKVYRKMYQMHINNSPNYRKYEKIMFHPDITITDYDFMLNKLKSWDNRALLLEFTFFSGLLVAYYKTKVGDVLRKNPWYAAITFGILPIVSLQSMLSLNKVLFDWKIKNMGLSKKYDVE